MIPLRMSQVFSELKEIVDYCDRNSPEIITLSLTSGIRVEGNDGFCISVLGDKTSGRFTLVREATYEHLLEQDFGWLKALKEEIDKTVLLYRESKEIKK